MAISSSEARVYEREGEMEEERKGKKNPGELLEYLLSPEDPNQSVFLFQKQGGMCLLNLVQHWKSGIHSLSYKILRRPVTKLEKEFIITQTLIIMPNGTSFSPLLGREHEAFLCIKDSYIFSVEE